MTSTQNQGTDVAKKGPSTDLLREIVDFESAAALLTKEFGAEVVSAAELGDGFTLEENKDELVGKPCMFVHWNFSEGDFGEFVAARVVVQEKNNTFRKVVVVDGSTGVFSQLKDISARHNGPAVVTAKRGLRKSEYETMIPNTKTGELEKKPATTYYIDTSN